MGTTNDEAHWCLTDCPCPDTASRWVANARGAATVALPLEVIGQNSVVSGNVTAYIEYKGAATGLASANLKGTATLNSFVATSHVGWSLGGGGGVGISGGTTETIDYTNSHTQAALTEPVVGGPKANIPHFECADGKRLTIVGQVVTDLSWSKTNYVNARAVATTDFDGGGLSTDVGQGACDPDDARNQVRPEVVHLLDVFSTLALDPCQLSLVISGLPERPTHREIDLLLESLPYDWQDRRAFHQCLDREALDLPKFLAESPDQPV